MVDQKDIFKIIKYGTMAPSADNNQPWYFRIKEDSIFVYLDKEKQTIKDFSNKNNIVDLISIGMFLENIRIASLSFDYQPKIIYNNEFKNNLVATINLIKNKKTPHKLFPFIPKRTTNRYKYQKNIVIGKKTLKDIKQITEQKGGKIYFVDNKKDKKKIAKTISYFDNILWSNQQKREDLLKTIRWTNQEAKSKKDGLILKALCLTKYQEKMFALLTKLTKKYPFLFSIIRLTSKHTSYKLIKGSSGLFVITMPKPNKTNYIQGGQIFENIWLYLTLKGINCHPMVGALFSSSYQFSPEGKKELTANQIKMTKKITKNLQEYFPISKNNALICLCRIGYAQNYSPKTYRHPVKELIKKI